MTEAKFLNSDDPLAMLAWLTETADTRWRRPISERKSHLFACACPEMAGWARSGQPNRPEMANLLREIVGNLWRPLIVLPRDLQAVLDAPPRRYQQDNVLSQDLLTPAVLSLGQAVYEKCR